MIDNFLRGFLTLVTVFCYLIATVFVGGMIVIFAFSLPKLFVLFAVLWFIWFIGWVQSD